MERQFDRKLSCHDKSTVPGSIIEVTTHKTARLFVVNNVSPVDHRRSFVYLYLYLQRLACALNPRVQGELQMKGRERLGRLARSGKAMCCSKMGAGTWFCIRSTSSSESLTVRGRRFASPCTLVPGRA